MSKILITGANGFIGSHLLLRCLSLGYDVVGWGKNQKNNNYIVKVDMNSIGEIADGLTQFKPDIVVHCAGIADVGLSVRMPERDFMGNVSITHNLLFSLHKMGLEKIKFIFLSSASVYGNPSVLPVTENSPLNPLSPYALHKVMCEDLCKYFAANYGMDVKIIRIFSAYGRGLKKQIFWDMYKKISSGKDVVMFGTGNESRDYIHVNDVVQSINLLICNNTDEMIFNVANGEEVTIRDAAVKFMHVCGATESRLKFNGEVREGDPLNWKADITRITKIGYKKSVEMQVGLHNYFEWTKTITKD